MRAALSLLALLVLALGTGCGGSGGGSSSETTSAAGTGCESVDAPEARNPGSRTAPTAPLAPGTTYTLTFETSCGRFTVTLDPASAPKTTASLVALAKEGFFDDTIFHRVARGFVIQGGDPTQTGSGGPGYSTVDPPPPDAAYPVGTVAMGKTEAEAPGTAGSQFFVVSGTSYALTPEYAIVGKVTKGLGTVERIDALGGQDGPPSQPVVIDRVTVTER